MPSACSTKPKIRNSPIRNAGTDTVAITTKLTNASADSPSRRAASRPSGIETRVAMNIAATASSRVIGNRDMIASPTDCSGGT